MDNKFEQCTWIGIDGIDGDDDDDDGKANQI